jgi:ABC-type uncharacterized transport system auxiliary subunit
MSRLHLRLLLPALLGALLGACSSDPVPELGYYELDTEIAGANRAQPLFAAPIAVDSFLADGVYNEQGILYQAVGQGSLHAYHYHLWEDAPTRLLQRRLIDTLRARHFSALVADRLPSASEQITVIGLIRRFDRVQQTEGWHAEVELELRVERGTAKIPLLVKDYKASERAADGTIPSSAHAFSVAVDRCFGEFASDLEKLAK